MAKRQTTITFKLSPKAKKRFIDELKRVSGKISQNGDNDDVCEKINQILLHNGGRISFNTKDLGIHESEFVAQLLGDISCFFFGVD